MYVILWYNIPSIICYKLQYQIISNTVWLFTFCHLLCVKTIYFGPDSKLITLFLHVSKGFCIFPSIIMNHYGPNRKLWTSSKVHLQKCSVFFTSHHFYFTFSDWILNYTHTSPARSLWHSSLIFSCTIWCVSPSLVLENPDLYVERLRCVFSFILVLFCWADRP